MSHTPRTTSTHRRNLVVSLLLLATVALVSCGDSYDSSSANTTTTTAGSGPAGTDAGAATVALGDTDLGRVLVDADGRTLYAFTSDSATASTCTGGCAQAWPPATAPSSPAAGDGVTAAPSVITRDDGSKQVVAGEHPLYTYAGDATAGEATGQGSGGTWFVVAADGSLISDDASSAPTTAGTKGGY
jgi:predicted lipoprotein with Yx(FWY)xxD motif